MTVSISPVSVDRTWTILFLVLIRHLVATYQGQHACLASAKVPERTSTLSHRRKQLDLARCLHFGTRGNL